MARPRQQTRKYQPIPMLGRPVPEKRSRPRRMGTITITTATNSTSTGSSTVGAKTPPSSRRSKAKSPGDLASPKTRTSTTPRSNRGSARRSAGDDEPEEVAIPEPGLYSAMFQKTSAMKKSVEKWVDSYAKNTTKGLLELITFFNWCSGCRVRVTEDMLEDVSVASKHLGLNFNEDKSGFYPLQQHTKNTKDFKDKFSAWVEHFVSTCQQSVLFDGYLLENLLNWLTAFSSSNIRAFRHTCSYAVLKLTSALISASNSFNELNNANKQQLEAENAKPKNKRSIDKISSLNEQIQENEKRIEALDGFISNAFVGVAVHRYRDSVAEIRALTITELGVWIATCSPMFLDDKYLKYIGWSLNDADGHVRNAALASLVALYSNEEVKSGLANFTQRFKSRILEMSEDIEDQVVEAAIRLIGVMLDMDVWAEEEIHRVCELVFAQSRTIAVAAGGFVHKTLILLGANTVIEQMKAKDDRTLKSSIILRSLSEFCCSFGEFMTDTKALYLSDALWDLVPELQHWDVYGILLKQDNNANDEDRSPEETILTSQEETYLLQLLLASIQRAIGKSSLRRKAFLPNQLKSLAATQSALSEEVLPLLPALFERCASNVEKCNILVQLPQHLDLTFYCDNLRDYNALLKLLTDALLKNSDEGLQQHVVVSLQSLSSVEDESLREAASSHLSSVFETLEKRLSDSMKKKIPRPSSDGGKSQELHAMISSLNRIAALYKCFDLSHCKTIPAQLAKLLDADDLHEEALSAALDITLASIVWDVVNIKSFSGSDDEKEAFVSSASASRDKISLVCGTLLVSGTELVQKKAYFTLMDMCFLLAPALGIPDLQFAMDEELQKRCYEYVRDCLLRENEATPEAQGVDLAELDARQQKVFEMTKLTTGFSQAVCLGQIDASFLGNLLPFYLQSKRMGEIFRHALSKLREVSPDGTANAIFSGLQLMYEDGLEQLKGEQAVSETARDIARRLASTFIHDATKHRTILLQLQQAGVRYALEAEKNSRQAPPHLGFLELLKEFVSRLVSQDKQTVLQLTTDILRENNMKPLEGNPAWASYFFFLTAINKKNVTTPMISPANKRKNQDDTQVKKRLNLETIEEDDLPPSSPRPSTSAASKKKRDADKDSTQSPSKRPKRSVARRNYDEDSEEENDDEEHEEMGDEDEEYEGEAQPDQSQGENSDNEEEASLQSPLEAKPRGGRQPRRQAASQRKDEEEEEEEENYPKSSQRSWLSKPAAGKSVNHKYSKQVASPRRSAQRSPRKASRLTKGDSIDYAEEESNEDGDDAAAQGSEEQQSEPSESPQKVAPRYRQRTTFSKLYESDDEEKKEEEAEESDDLDI